MFRSCGLYGLFPLARFYRGNALWSSSGLSGLSRLFRTHLFRSCGLYGLFLLTRFCRGNALWSSSGLSGLSRLFRTHSFRSCGLHGLFLLTRFCRGHALWSSSGLSGLSRLFRTHSFRSCGLHRLAGYPGTLDLSLLKLYFRCRTVHFACRHDIVRDLGRFDPALAVNPPLRDALHSFPDHGSFFFLARMNDRLILLNSVDHGIVRLLFHRDVGVVVPLVVRRVIIDHRIADDRCRTVVIDDGGGVDVGHPDLRVIVHTVEIALVDHDGAVYVSIIPDIDVDLGDVDVVHDHHMRATPVAVAVVRLARCQRHPSHIRSSVNP